MKSVVSLGPILVSTRHSVLRYVSGLSVFFQVPDMSDGGRGLRVKNRQSGQCEYSLVPANVGNNNVAACLIFLRRSPPYR